MGDALPGGAWSSGLCSFSHTGAFNAFDKDGDGIIKLNVLEVKPVSLPLYLKIQSGVNEADWTHCVLLT